MILRIFRTDKRHGYVIDKHGNKLFYGTLYGCRKFVRIMKEEMKDDGQGSGT